MGESTTEQKSKTHQIELTAKKYKAMQLIGFVVAVFGGLLLAPGLVVNNVPLVSVGAVVLFGGLVTNWIGRGLAWWHHG